MANFGKLITYTGKYLSKATDKAVAAGGNLVFARITGSTSLSVDHADYDKDGFYIYAGGAEALMVTKEDFESLKTKVGDLTIDGTTYEDVPKYVSASLAAISGAAKLGVAEEINENSTHNDAATAKAVYDYVSGTIDGLELGDASKKGVATSIASGEVGLTTGDQVYQIYNHVSGDIAVALEDAKDYADGLISSLGTVMSFIGVVELAQDQTFDTTNATVTINGEDKTAENGDVVIVGNKEYVWESTSNSWKEFGDASAESAAITKLQEDLEELSGAVGAITGAEAIEFDGETITLKIAEGTNAGNVTLTQDDNGLKADVTLPTAETLDYAGETLEGETEPTTEATNVKDALDDLFKSDKVISEALVDLNDRLDDISGAVGAISVTGDAASYSEVTGSAVDGYVVKNTLATATSAGLVTDSYLDDRLSWQVLSDDDSILPDTPADVPSIDA